VVGRASLGGPGECVSLLCLLWNFCWRWGFGVVTEIRGVQGEMNEV
jgi:hypothetical protein